MAGRNTREHRGGPERHDAKADPTWSGGRLVRIERFNWTTGSIRFAGVVGDSMSSRINEQHGKPAWESESGILSRLGLTLNRSKTRICHVNDESFDFLGYSFGVQYRFGSGQKYLAAYPSVDSVRRLKAKLRRMIGNHMSWISEEEMVSQVNRVLRGWTNYFSYGTL
jgi:hypothetical protein